MAMLSFKTCPLSANKFVFVCLEMRSLPLRNAFFVCLEMLPLPLRNAFFVFLEMRLMTAKKCVLGWFRFASFVCLKKRPLSA